MAETKAKKFMEARILEGEARHQAFLASLDPRQREALGFVDAEE